VTIWKVVLVTLDARTLVQAVVKAAEEKKAGDIVVLDIGPVSVICDYFVIASGRSTTHVKAIGEHVEKELASLGVPWPRREGFVEGRWVLLDYGDVVVHLFVESEREFYNLERLWQDAQVVSL
jgi:ribosome-associated protein